MGKRDGYLNKAMQDCDITFQNCDWTIQGLDKLMENLYLLEPTREQAYSTEADSEQVTKNDTLLHHKG